MKHDTQNTVAVAIAPEDEDAVNHVQAENTGKDIRVACAFAAAILTLSTLFDAVSKDPEQTPALKFDNPTDPIGDASTTTTKNSVVPPQSQSRLFSAKGQTVRDHHHRRNHNNGNDEIRKHHHQHPHRPHR